MREQTLYLECNSGISGDMTVAALLDLGADENVLRTSLESLHLGGYQIQISRVSKSGLDACDFHVILEEENGDHDMNYLHGDGHSHEFAHSSQEQVHHHHGEESQPHEHKHIHQHRGLQEILTIIESSQITQNAKQIAEKIFQILADAEAKAHGVPRDQVHFHEVGAVDSIVDVVSVAVCLDNLQIKCVVVPWLCEGHGSIRCQHGIIPVPVPAVLNIVADNELVLKPIDVEGELVTPTGAAIVAAVRTQEVLPSLYKIRKTGYGAGKREYSRPSILRAMLIQETSQLQDTIYKLETNVDDCTGENLGYVMDLLMEEGARDVHYTPVYMKKNRPAYQLNVICTREDVEKLEEILFRETTTIGIRRIEMERSILKRRQVAFVSSMGKAQLKICEYKGTDKIYPEYESVSALAREKGLSYGEVYHRLVQEAMEAKV